jgi:ubiquinone/menaquinone biosynthesis C-methylase UbiE
MKLNWAERLAVNNPLRPLQQRLEINWYQKHLKLDPGARILEIGCGRGAGSYLIRKTFRPCEIHAMDLDIDMIKKAQTYLLPERREKIAFSVGDVCQLPYPDETMDAIFGFGVLHHIPDWQGALKEIVRVLKIGGIYCFEELYPSLYQNIITRHILLHPTENRFRSEELKLGIAESGLAMGRYVENKYLEILGFATKT